ncbi:MAG: hypothetical protein P8Q50_13830 [Octadecabacter sp.]|nr:hypothetical protein [Octadecabacter sp.]
MLLLRKFAENTYVKLVAGLTLLLTSFYDLITESEVGLQSEHGIIVFSLLHILRVLPELQHGASEIASIRVKKEK